MSSDHNEEIDWNKVVEKEAMGENGLDLGTIKQIGDDHVVTEMGGLTKKKYNLPKSKAKSFNGVFLNFSLSDSDVSTYEIKEDNIDSDGDSLMQSLKSTQQKEEVLVPLIGEDLNVAKKITEENVKIVKEPIKETKTVQIELMHEKITIERRVINNNDTPYNSKPNSGQANYEPTRNEIKEEKSGGKESVYSKIEIRIPVRREEPIITKKPLIREEIVVKKIPVTETKNISEKVTNEEIEYINTKD